MQRVALLFAGQGAQSVGMGKEFAEQFPAAKKIFQRAGQILGYDLAKICFEGPDDELTKTEHAQPAIYLVSWVAFQLLKERLPTLRFSATAGLSLGEFTALAAAGSLSFEDGLQLVRARGLFMQEACESTKGGMAAIIGLDEATTREICKEAGVELANLNCPGQIVVSGEMPNIKRACEIAKARGAKRALPLAVAGAYHSPLMASAQPKLSERLSEVPVSTPSVPVISNVTAKPHDGPDDIRRLLTEQVTSPVRWEESIRYLLQEKFNCFVELGPGAALSGFMKRIDPNAQSLNISDPPSLQATVQALTNS